MQETRLLPSTEGMAHGGCRYVVFVIFICRQTFLLTGIQYNYVGSIARSRISDNMKKALFEKKNIPLGFAKKKFVYMFCTR